MAITCSKRYDKKAKQITHTAPLLKRLNILSLNDSYYLQLALFAYDCMRTNNLPSLFSNYVETISNVYDSRTCELDLRITRTNLFTTFNSIQIASPYF